MMAKVGNNLPGLTGRVGNLIYYYRNNTLCVRSSPVSRKRDSSPKVKVWRNRFKACTRFYYSLNGVEVKPIWDQLAKLKGMAGLNVFISSNIHAFDEDSSIGNHELIHFSSGRLMMPKEFDIRERQGNKIEVGWDPEWLSTFDSGTDRLLAGVIYDDEPSRPCLAETVSGIRSEGKGIIELRDGYSGRCHLYCYFMAHEGHYYSGDKYFRV